MALTSITVEPLGTQHDRTVHHGGAAALVDAKDESAASFYRHFGFLSLQAQPSRLFVPMRLLAQLLA